MNRETAKGELAANLLWGACMLVLAFGASHARKLGYLDADTVKRVVIGANGLWFAWYGNRMPKTFVPNACARRVRRFAGWSMVLSGFVDAALWATAPIHVAAVGGSVAILGGIALTLGFCLSLRNGTRTA
jgi:hypothetical protein